MKKCIFVGHFVVTVFLYRQVVSLEVLHVHNTLYGLQTIIGFHASTVLSPLAQLNLAVKTAFHVNNIQSVSLNLH